MKEFDLELIRFLHKKHPETHKEAVKLLSSRFPGSFDDHMKWILRLENEGKISFEKPIVKRYLSLTEYLFCDDVHWFWSVIFLTSLSMFIVFLVSENIFVVSFKYVVGSALVLFFPGYSLIRALSINKEFGIVEITALSLVLSLPIVAFVGLIMNYTVWGLSVPSIVFCLFALILFFAFIAVFRDFRLQKKDVDF